MRRFRLIAGVVSLLFFAACRPTVTDDMGEVRYRPPDLPGLETPYELPEWETSSATSDSPGSAAHDHLHHDHPDHDHAEPGSSATSASSP